MSAVLASVKDTRSLWCLVLDAPCTARRTWVMTNQGEGYEEQIDHGSRYDRGSAGGTGPGLRTAHPDLRQRGRAGAERHDRDAAERRSRRVLHRPRQLLRIV